METWDVVEFGVYCEVCEVVLTTDHRGVCGQCLPDWLEANPDEADDTEE